MEEDGFDPIMMAEPNPVVESIETPNLTGRRICVDDFAELAAMGQDARVMATLGGVRSEEESREILQKGIDHWERYGYGFWVFRDKTDNGSFMTDFDNIFHCFAPNRLPQLGLELPDRWKTQHGLVLVMALCTLGVHAQVGQAGVSAIDRVQVSNHSPVPQHAVSA